MSTALIAFVLFALVALLGIGGVVYAGYKGKQKIAALLHKNSPDATNPEVSAAPPGQDESKASQARPSDQAAEVLQGLSTLFGNTEDDSGDNVESVNDRTPVEPCSVAPTPVQSAARIPLQEGTVITTAWGMKNGDVETRISVVSTSPTALIEEAATESFKDDDGHSWNPEPHRDTVCNSDLARADTYVTVGSTSMPHLIHGVTRLRLSAQSFEDVKRSGKTQLRYLDIVHKGDDVKLDYEQGVLTRVEPQDVSYAMIVNDQAVTLPVLHLAGTMDIVGKDPRPKEQRPHHTAAEFYVLDDPADPLVLLMKLKDPALHDGKFRIEVVKIEYKVPQPVNLVEKQLTEQKRAITYGIYFDFNKDTLKPESEPVLKQIVQALADHPDWKLTVNGYTDNIGGDAYNRDLSKRRAAAVKQALVTRFHIDPARLASNGYGNSSPIDTNDTLEGRARNRRVELTRE